MTEENVFCIFKIGNPQKKANQSANKRNKLKPLFALFCSITKPLNKPNIRTIYMYIFLLLVCFGLLFSWFDLFNLFTNTNKFILGKLHTYSITHLCGTMINGYHLYVEVIFYSWRNIYTLCYTITMLNWKT